MASRLASDHQVRWRYPSLWACDVRLLHTLITDDSRSVYIRCDVPLLSPSTSRTVHSASLPPPDTLPQRRRPTRGTHRLKAHAADTVQLREHWPKSLKHRRRSADCTLPAPSSGVHPPSSTLRPSITGDIAHQPALTSVRLDSCAGLRCLERGSLCACVSERGGVRTRLNRGSTVVKARPYMMAARTFIAATH